MNRTYQDRRNAAGPAPEEAREEPEAPAPDDRDEGPEAVAGGSEPSQGSEVTDGEILQRYEG